MEADEELASATTRPLTMVVKTVWEIPLKLESAVLSALVSEEVESVLLRGPSRATNSRTIFLVFTNSRTTEGLRVSLFFCPFTNHKSRIYWYLRIHEQIFQFFTISRTTFCRFTIHESRTKSFWWIQERYFSFSRIHERKKANSRLPERRWGASSSGYSRYKNIISFPYVR